MGDTQTHGGEPEYMVGAQLHGGLASQLARFSEARRPPGWAGSGQMAQGSFLSLKVRPAAGQVTMYLGSHYVFGLPICLWVAPNTFENEIYRIPPISLLKGNRDLLNGSKRKHIVFWFQIHGGAGGDT